MSWFNYKKSYKKMATYFWGFGMKKALLIGCGGKRGEDLIKGCQQANFDVINIGSSKSTLKNVENIKINWETFDIAQMHKSCKQLSYNFDFIFFAFIGLFEWDTYIIS